MTVIEAGYRLPVQQVLLVQVPGSSNLVSHPVVGGGGEEEGEEQEGEGEGEGQEGVEGEEEEGAEGEGVWVMGTLHGVVGPCHPQRSSLLDTVSYSFRWE